MASMCHYPHLFSPIRIGNFEVPNRVCHVPTDISSANADGSVNQRVLTYHEQIAKGGCGLIIVGASTPDRATGRPTVTCVTLDEDPLIPGLAELAEVMHRHGARCSIQIQHPGRQSAWPRKGLISATDQVTSLEGSTGHEVVYAGEVAKGKSIREMSVDDIYEIVEKFGEAAWRVQQAKFDCVELHGAHGYMISEFISPYVNRRNDRFGGTFLNRMRFVLEIIACIKRKCGSDFPIGVRYSAEEFVAGGRTLSESVQVAQLLEQHGAMFLDISAGISEIPATVLDTMEFPQGWNTYTAAEIKKHVKLPVITSHSLRDPSLCENIIAGGQADLVGLSRQLIADPNWANKAYTGHTTEIRKCISCCVGCFQESIFSRRHVRCSVNPAIGDERFLHMQPARERLRVAIVGGGPGGMEAARIATLRGHHATIFEKTGELGGAILYCCSVPGRSKMRWYADWLRRQIKKLAVDVRYLSTPGVPELKGYDAVVLATGSKARRPEIPGIDSPIVLPFEDVMRCGLDNCQFHPEGRVGPAATGESVLVWGDHFAAVDAATELASAGKKVSVVTEAQEFALWMEPCHRDVVFKTLAGSPVEGLKTKPFAHAVSIIPNTTLMEIAADGKVTLMDKEFRKSTLQVDNVVLAALEPASSPYEELCEAGVLAIRIGDHKQVRNLGAAVREGAGVGLTLDQGLMLNANRTLVSLLPTEVDLGTHAAVESEEPPAAA